MPANDVSDDDIAGIGTGLDGAIGSLTDTFENNALSTVLPVIGSALSAGGSTGQALAQTLQTFRAAISGALSRIEPEVLHGTYAMLASLLQNAIDANLMQAGLHGTASVSVTDDNKFVLRIEDDEHPAAFTTDLGPDLGTGSLGLTVTGTANLTATLDVDETVTIDPENLFKVTTSGSGLVATVDAGALDFTADANLGPGHFNVTDNGSSATGAFTITPHGVSSYTGSAKLDLHLAADLGNAEFPSLSADLDGSWNVDHALVGPSATGAFGDKPTISFDNVTLDLGQFVSQFVKPLLDEIQPLLAPVQAFLNVFDTDLTVLKSVLGPAWHQLDSTGAVGPGFVDAGDGRLTLLDLIKDGTLLQGQDISFVGVSVAVDALSGLALMASTLEQLNGLSAEYDLGSFTLPGDIRDAAFRLAQQVPQITQSAQTLADALHGFANNQKVISNGYTIAQEIGTLTDQVSALQAEGLTPATEFETLLGGDATLASFTIPDFHFGVGSIDSSGNPTSTVNLAKFYVFPGVDISLDAALQASLGVSVGFDTTGLLSYAAGNFTDPSQILNGLWVADADPTLQVPLAQLAGDVELNVNAGIDPIASISGGGDIEGDVDFYLAQAGKNYYPQLAAAISNGALFDTSGRVTAGFDASVNTFLGQIWQGHSPRVTLASFDEPPTNIPENPPSALGVAILDLNGMPGVTQGLVVTGSVVHFQATFDKAVDVRGTASLMLNDGGTATFDRKATTALGDPNSLVFTYTAAETDFSEPALEVLSANGGVVEGNIPDTLPARSVDLSSFTKVVYDGVPVDTAVTRTFIAPVGDFATQADWDRQYVSVTANTPAHDSQPASSVKLNIYGDAVIASGNQATFGAGPESSARMESLDVRGNAVLDVAGGQLDITGSLKLDSSVAGLLDIASGGTVQLADDLSNTGFIAVGADAFGDPARFLFTAATVKLTGGGQVLLSDSAANQLDTGVSSDLDVPQAKLDNVDNSISGAGMLGSADPHDPGLLIENEAAGQILGSGTHGLQVYGTLQNAGTIGAVGLAADAPPTGGLVLHGKVYDDLSTTALGTIVARQGGLVTLGDGSQVEAGTLDTPGGDDGATITTQGAALLEGDDEHDLVNHAKLVVGAGSTLTVSGTVDQTRFAGAGVNDPRLSAGTGVLLLTDEVTVNDGWLSSDAGGMIETSEHVALAASAGVGPGLFTDALIHVDSRSYLSLTGSIANAGTIEVAGGLGVRASLDNTGGLLSVLAGGAVTLDATTLSGGMLLTSAGSSGTTIGAVGAVRLDGTASVLTNLARVDATLDMSSGDPSQSLRLLGTIDQAGAGGEGDIVADSEVVQLDGAIIQGGTLGVVDTGRFVLDSDSTLDGSAAAVTVAGPLSVADGDTLTLRGSIVNTGTITVQGDSGVPATTVLRVEGAATLSGGGTVTMADAYYGSSAATQVVDGTGSAVLENVDNTIDGLGQLGDGTLGIENDAGGTIDADIRTLTVDTGAGALVNAGLMEATSGTLELHGTVQNAGGTVAAAGGLVDLAGATVIGGTLASSDGGTVHVLVDAALTGLTQAADVELDPGTVLTLAGDIVNTGSIALNGSSASGTAEVQVTDGTTLSGDGTLFLQDTYYNSSAMAAVVTGAAGATLDNAGNLILGAGLLGAGTLSLVNAAAGHVEAYLGTLTVDGGKGVASVNHGTMTALGGSTLRLAGDLDNDGTVRAEADGTVLLNGAVDNSAGTVAVDGGGHLVLDGASLTGGVLSSDAGADLRVPTTATIDGGTASVSLSGTLTVEPGATLTLAGALDNAGTVVIEGDSSAAAPVADLRLRGAATLSGGGVVTLEDIYYGSSSSAAVVDGEPGASLDNVDDTITGSGLLGAGTLAITNEAAGKIEAASGTLTVDAGGQTVANAGLLEASDSGTLVLKDAVTNTGTIEADATGTVDLRGSVDNAAGLVAAASGGAVVLDGGAVLGGQVSTVPTGTLVVTTTGLLDGTSAPLALGGLLTVQAGATLSLRGAVGNSGMIELDGNSSQTGPVAALHLEGTVALSGAGTLMLDDLYYGSSPSVAAVGGEAGAVLDNLDNTITGYGLLGDGTASVINEAAGTIEAVGNTLTVDAGSGTVANHGLMRARLNGTLALDDALVNTGTIEANDTGTVVLHGTVTNTGGLVASNPGGAIVLDGGSVVDGRVSSSPTGSLTVVSDGVLDGRTAPLDLGGLLTVDAGATLTLEGAVANAGTIDLPANSSASDPVAAVQLRGAVSLSGGGVVMLHDVYYNSSSAIAVIGGEPGASLDNADDTITGYGLLGNGTASITNATAGTIDATTGTLTVDAGTGALANSGLMEATAAGTLAIQTALTNTGTIEAGATAAVALGGTIANTGGVVSADGGGTIVLDGGGVVGGTFSIAATGALEVTTTGLLDGSFAPFALAGATTVDAGAILTLADDIANSGTISIDGNSAQDTPVAAVRLRGTVTLGGGGQVALRDVYYGSSPTAAVVEGEAGSELDNADNTIVGSGLLGDGTARLVNEAGGTIEGTTGTLTVDAAGAGLANAGLMQAESGTLVVQDQVANTGTIRAGVNGIVVLQGDIDETNGTVEAQAGGQVVLDDVAVRGGPVTADAGGAILATGTSLLDGTVAALRIGGNLSIQNGATLSLLGTVHNTGTIAIDGNTASTDPVATLQVQGTVQLSGGGELALQDIYYGSSSTAAVVDGTAGSLLDNVDDTITGYGLLGDGTAGITNEAGGTIDATGSTLTVDTGAAGLRNAGLMEAILGRLVLRGEVANTAGTIAPGDNGTVVLDTATIAGGLLASTPDGRIFVGSSAVLDGTASPVTVTGALVVGDRTTLALRGAILDMGTIAVDGNSADNNGVATLEVDGAATLSGGGALVLQDIYYSSSPTVATVDGGAGSSLDNLDATIEGSGLLGTGQLVVTNEAAGTIEAVNGTLTTGPNAVTNAGLMEAGVSGTLRITGTVTNDGAGQVVAEGNGTVLLDGGTIAGGQVTQEAGGVLTVTASGTLSGTLSGVALSGTATVSAGGTLTLEGTIDNAGTIAVNGYDGYAAATVRLLGAVTLTGGGPMTLTDGYYGSSSTVATVEGDAGSSLDLADGTVVGQGVLGQGIGSIAAGTAGTIQASGATLTVAAGCDLTNFGTLRADVGATLELDRTVDNQGTVVATTGLVAVDAGAANLASGTLTGGTWIAQDGTVAFAGQAIATDAASIVLDGVGAVVTGGGASLDSSLTQIAAGGTLAVLGGRDWTAANTLLNAGTLHLGGGTFTEALLVNTGVIFGSGVLDGMVVNQGRIVTEAGLVVKGTAEGDFAVDAGGTLDLAGGQAAGQVTLGAGSHLVVEHAAAAAGLLLTDFYHEDTVDLADFQYVAGSTTFSYSAATGLLAIDNGSQTATLSFGAGNDVVDDPFHLGPDGGNGTLLTNDAVPACYCPGTRIMTGAGEVPVEDLRIGDLVVDRSGALRPVHWIGRRAYAARFAARNPALRPVRFRAGSLGPGLPARDLLVSPKHAMLLDGCLVPAEHLVDGIGIVREASRGPVEYLHVELEDHDAILAEGVLSETFLDDGSRGMFQNAPDYARLYPGRRASCTYCARRVEGGFELEAIRRRLARDRAAA